MRVSKNPFVLFILRLKSPCGAAYFTGRTGHTLFRVQSSPAKKKDRRHNHDLATEHVDHHHMLFKERHGIQGAVGKEIAGDKRQARNDDQYKVRYG